MRPTDTLTPEDLLELDRQKAYVKALDKTGKPGSIKARRAVIKKIALEIGDQSPPSVSTVYRWYRRLITMGDLVRRLRKSAKRFACEVEAVFLDVIDDYILSQQGCITLEAYGYFVERTEPLREQGLKVFAKSTFYARVAGICQLLKLREQQGKKGSKTFERTALQQYLFDTFLERIEMDAAVLNLSLVEDETGEVVGPFTVFFVLECYSRSILGIHLIQGTGESANNVLQSLVHSLVPKPMYAFVGGKYAWSQYGAGDTYATDGLL